MKRIIKFLGKYLFLIFSPQGALVKNIDLKNSLLQKMNEANTLGKVTSHELRYKISEILAGGAKEYEEIRSKIMSPDSDEKNHDGSYIALINYECNDKVLSNDDRNKCMVLCIELKILYECTSKNLYPHYKSVKPDIDPGFLPYLNEMRVEMNRRLDFVNRVINVLKTKKV